MNENTIQELITFIKNASPLMWETLIRQVYSDAITGGIWAFMCLLLSAFSVGMLKASAKMKNEKGIVYFTDPRCYDPKRGYASGAVQP